MRFKKIPTAAEIRKIEEEAMVGDAEAVLECIYEAARDGKSKAFYPAQISTRTRSQLEARGFVITFQPDSSNAWTVIGW